MVKSFEKYSVNIKFILQFVSFYWLLLFRSGGIVKIFVWKKFKGGGIFGILLKNPRKMKKFFH